MKIYSRTYEKEFDIELCPKEQGENFDVISHKSLQDIHDVDLRGELTTTIRTTVSLKLL